MGSEEVFEFKNPAEHTENLNEVEEFSFVDKNLTFASETKPTYFKSSSLDDVRSLKENFLPVLISPRVSSLPSRYKLGVLSNIVIILFAIVAGEIQVLLQVERVCRSTSVPVLEEECFGIQFRNDFFVDLEEVGIPGFGDSVSFSLEVNLPNPTKNVEELLLLNSTKLDEVNNKLNFANSNSQYSQNDGFSLSGNQVPSLLKDTLESVTFFENVVTQAEYGNDGVRIFKYSFEYQTEIGTECLVEGLANELLIGFLTVSCSMTKMSFISEFNEAGAFAQLLALFQNFHSDKDDNFIKDILTNEKLSYCCRDVERDRLEVYGFNLGFGFALEGLFTFLLAVTIFRNKLGLEKTDNENYTHSSINTFSFVDVKRALFNPRCHNIPYANLVSVVTLAVVILVSVAVGLFVRDERGTYICEITTLEDISTQENNGAYCEKRTNLNNFAFIPTAVGSVGMTGILEAYNIASLELDQWIITADQASQIAAACNGSRTFDESLSSCIETTDYFNLTRRDFYNYTEDGTNVTVFILNEFYDCSLGSALEDDDIGCFFGYEEILEVDESSLADFLAGDSNKITRSEISLTLEYLIEEENFEVTRYYTNSFVQSDSLLNSGFNSLGDASEVVTQFFRYAVGDNASVFLFAPLNVKFFSCCGVTRLSQFEYIGLMIGYITLVEGLITFLVAIFIYAIFSLLRKVVGF